jgi:copper resistance protein B
MNARPITMLLAVLLFAAAPAFAQHAHHPAPPPEEPTEEPAEAEPAVDHAAMGHAPASTHTPVPAPTDADRAAAVKPAGGHAAHGNSIHSYVLFDRLEASRDDGESAASWEIEGWVGGDIDRLWLRSEGEHAHGDVEGADIELLYGRSVTPWWDVVAGVRHDFGEAPSQTFAAFGVQGLTPYKIELAATAYVGASGQTALHVEAEYDTLLSNRLILQWVAEAEAFGQRDARRGIGAGLNTVEAGLRLRYEIRREFAPYVGVAWERRFGDAADWRRAEGGDVQDVRVVAGLRFWF